MSITKKYFYTQLSCLLLSTTPLYAMESRGGAGGDSDDDVLMSAPTPPVSTPEVAPPVSSVKDETVSAYTLSNGTTYHYNISTGILKKNGVVVNRPTKKSAEKRLTYIPKFFRGPANRAIQPCDFFLWEFKEVKNFKEHKDRVRDILSKDASTPEELREVSEFLGVAYVENLVDARSSYNQTFGQLDNLVSIEYRRVSVQYGNIPSMIAMGDFAAKAGDINTAFKWYLLAFEYDSRPTKEGGKASNVEKSRKAMEDVLSRIPWKPKNRGNFLKHLDAFNPNGKEHITCYMGKAVFPALWSDEEKTKRRLLSEVQVYVEQEKTALTRMGHPEDNGDPYGRFGDKHQATSLDEAALCWEKSGSYVSLMMLYNYFPRGDVSTSPYQRFRLLKKIGDLTLAGHKPTPEEREYDRRNFLLQMLANALQDLSEKNNASGQSFIQDLSLEEEREYESLLERLQQNTTNPAISAAFLWCQTYLYAHSPHGSHKAEAHECAQKLLSLPKDLCMFYEDLGHWYLNGLIACESPQEEAFRFWERTAKGLAKIGGMYEEGKRRPSGGENPFELAKAYYERSKTPSAMVDLGCLYATKQLASANDKEAFETAIQYFKRSQHPQGYSYMLLIYNDFFSEIGLSAPPLALIEETIEEFYNSIISSEEIIFHASLNRKIELCINFHKNLKQYDRALQLATSTKERAIFFSEKIEDIKQLQALERRASLLEEEVRKKSAASPVPGIELEPDDSESSESESSFEDTPDAPATTAESAATSLPDADASEATAAQSDDTPVTLTLNFGETLEEELERIQTELKQYALNFQSTKKATKKIPQVEATAHKVPQTPRTSPRLVFADKKVWKDYTTVCVEGSTSYNYMAELLTTENCFLDKISIGSPEVLSHPFRGINFTISFEIDKTRGDRMVYTIGDDRSIIVLEAEGHYRDQNKKLKATSFVDIHGAQVKINLVNHRVKKAK